MLLLTHHDRFRIAALRPFGDRTVAADWDIFSTPDITFLP